jgi:GDP-4-dehydro-6-deoxy-D-mannose reductase
MIDRALIVGASGFVGRHLAAHLAELGGEVVGSARGAAPENWDGEWRQLDIRRDDELETVIGEVRPSAIFHLATAVRGAPLDELLAVNVGGTQRLLAAAGTARVVVGGSSAEYGFAQPSDLPLDEAAALRPLGPYGIAKCAQSLLALARARAGADTVVLRTFNLVGPGEPDDLVCSAFARQIAAVEAGTTRQPIAVGNLDAERDFLDVRDAVRAYALAAEHGSAGEVYNACSGRATRISEILSALVANAQVPIEVVADPARGSAADVPVQYGDASHLTAATGWTPAIPLSQSLDDLLEWWRDYHRAS